MIKLIFWGSALLLLHTYFFYPLILFILDGVDQALANIRFMRRGGERRRRFGEMPLPKVSLVVAAYNEEACIQQKIDNSLELQYPTEKFQVLIGSDGSDDRTEAIVRQCHDRRVSLSAGARAGKTSVLNRCIPVASGDIIVLSDANTRIAPEAIMNLVRHFSDPEVGAVCGKLKLFNPNQEEYEESAYWTYESLIKFYEGKRGAVMGANGGLYAIRRRLFQDLPKDTIVDDFVIPLRILENGYKVVYDPEAVAFEETTEDYEHEFGRRARIAAGNFQSLSLVPGLLSPTSGFRAFAFISHKLLRWVAPGLMALAFLTNWMLIGRPMYRVLLAMQLVFYGLAFAGKAALFQGGLRRICSVAYYFVTMNWAIAVGFWRYTRRSQAAAWERTARAAP